MALTEDTRLDRWLKTPHRRRSTPSWKACDGRLVDRGYLDLDALLESLDMTMAEFEVVAQQDNFPGPQMRDPRSLLWAPADVAKWRDGGEKKLLCSFCGKSQGAVPKLIEGPGVSICNECIDLCNEIIEEEGRPARLWRNILALARKAGLVSSKARGASLRTAADDDEGAVVMSPPETDEELDRLWHAYKAQDRDDAREMLIMHYAPLVLHTIDAFGPIDRSEFISYGMFGLIDALTRFKPSSGESFETFSRPHIREAILGELREISRDTPHSD